MPELGARHVAELGVKQPQICINVRTPTGLRPRITPPRCVCFISFRLFTSRTQIGRLPR